MNEKKNKTTKLLNNLLINAQHILSYMLYIVNA